MGVVYLNGWDADALVWRKLVCNAAGKLIIDPTEIFEDVPTDNELGKAPTSNWASDHDADEAAHHAKFTTVEHDTAARHGLANLDPLVCSEAEADSKISTHAAIAAAHHSRYIDAEAVAAVGYNGTKYWSCPGIHFEAKYPDIDDITNSPAGYIIIYADNIHLSASVLLPHGAVITRAIVTGNAGSQAKTWSLKRITLASGVDDVMGSANVNSPDVTISYDTINNTDYAYFFIVADMLNTDMIFGAMITYTI